jgi:hypothetical protein
MRNIIAAGLLGLALFANGAAAQTASERARILGDFERSVADYTQRHKCLDLFPEAINAATPVPKIFTLPVAVVFRQLLNNVLEERTHTSMIGTVRGTHHPEVLQPFPANELGDFPHALAAALPPLPVPLEYRLIDRDLVIRDGNADVIVAVLRDAIGMATTRR